MKKRLAVISMSAMVIGAVVLPAPPAQAGHCNTTIHNYHEYVACSWEHVAQCVAEVIRQEQCLDPN